jgi:hypothetical protein
MVIVATIFLAAKYGAGGQKTHAGPSEEDDDEDRPLCNDEEFLNDAMIPGSPEHRILFGLSDDDLMKTN